MRYDTWFVGVILAVTLAGGATPSVAQPAETPPKLTNFINSVVAQPAELPPRLANFINSVVEQHPTITAAREAVAAARARQDAAGQPLYNPEVEVGVETGAIEESYSAGFSQRLDWTDKRGVRERAAARQVTAAEVRLALARQKLASEILVALVEYRTAEEKVELAAERIEVLKRFAELALERKRAGDIGQVDFDLARLAQAEALSAFAEAELVSNRALQDLRSLASMEGNGWPELPDALPPKVESADFEQLARQHPQVVALRAESNAAEAGIEVAESSRRADPSVGLSVIREGSEVKNNGIGLSFSIPLYIRNDYSAEVAAAGAEANAVEARMFAEYRRVAGRLETTLQSYKESRVALNRWQDAVSGHLDQGLDLLERLWKVGEISATDYLLQVEQRVKARSSGLRLHALTWQTWADWLAASGQLTKRPSTFAPQS